MTNEMLQANDSKTTNTHMLAGLRQRGEGIIHPTRPAFGCGYVRRSLKEWPPPYCCWAFDYMECYGDTLEA
jgi:hypothetical protein